MYVVQSLLNQGVEQQCAKTRGVWGHAPKKTFNSLSEKNFVIPLRLLLVASETSLMVNISTYNDVRLTKILRHLRSPICKFPQDSMV